VKRSGSPILRNSPDRSNQPPNRVTYSPERTPIDPPYSSGNPEDSREEGPRHRSSQNRTQRDDNAQHSDNVERSKPPRSSRNAEGWEQGPSSTSKPYAGESRFDRDLERGREGWPPGGKRHSDEEDSLDGYNYDSHRKRPARRKIDFKNLSPEEKAEVLRLPWTQWMNSSIKNRKFDSMARVFMLIVDRLCCNNWRVRRHDHVSLLCLRRHSGRQHSVRRLPSVLIHQQHNFRGSNRLQCLCLPLHLTRLRFLPDGECMDILPYIRRPVQPRRDAWNGARRCAPNCQSTLCFWCTNCWRHCCFGDSYWAFPGQIQCQDHSRRRYQYSAGGFYRGILDSRTRLHYFHACQGEA
jgi:hypothetical protein